MRTSVCLFFSIVLLLPMGMAVSADEPPYPASSIIRSVSFDFDTHISLAPGSDNWPVTWADDDHQYTAWGDGGGFGGTNSLGRVKLGVARIEGAADSYQGINVWGGHKPQIPAQFEGKSYGILSIKGVLYMWVAPQPNPHLHECRIARSVDHGLTWERADWAYVFSDNLTIPTFLNFGKDYADARDGYVYSYYIHPTYGPGEPSGTRYGFDVHKPGRIYLSRVPQDRIMERDYYEFFAGFNENESPVWTKDLTKKQPVFEDPNGVGWNLSVSHNAGLDRYILCTEHTRTHAGRLGMFDAPEPWGPWTTVLYEDRWGFRKVALNTFYWNFSTKWLSPDGTSFTFIFTGKDANDSWNTIQGTFQIDESSSIDFGTDYQ